MSGQRDIRLLVADVDGTPITQDKVLTEAAKAAVRELYGAGIALAITSGRPPRGDLEGALHWFRIQRAIQWLQDP